MFIFTIFDVKTVKTMFLHITWLSCFFVFFFFLMAFPHTSSGNWFSYGFSNVFPSGDLKMVQLLVEGGANVFGNTKQGLPYYLTGTSQVRNFDENPCD